MDIQSLALRAAQAGAIAVSEFPAEHTHAIGRKGDGHTSPVTGADLASETAIRSDAYLVLADVAPFVQDLRNSGSTVCDLASVAAGEIGGFITFDPAPWDIAHGGITIDEGRSDSL